MRWSGVSASGCSNQSGMRLEVFAHSCPMIRHLRFNHAWSFLSLESKRIPPSIAQIDRKYGCKRLRIPVQRFDGESDDLSVTSMFDPFFLSKADGIRQLLLFWRRKWRSLRCDHVWSLLSFASRLLSPNVAQNSRENGNKRLLIPVNISTAKVTSSRYEQVWSLLADFAKRCSNHSGNTATRACAFPPNASTMKVTVSRLRKCLICASIQIERHSFESWLTPPSVAKLIREYGYKRLRITASCFDKKMTGVPLSKMFETHSIPIQVHSSKIRRIPPSVTLISREYSCKRLLTQIKRFDEKQRVRVRTCWKWRFYSK